MIEGKVEKILSTDPTKKTGKMAFFLYVKNTIPKAGNGLI